MREIHPASNGGKGEEGDAPRDNKHDKDEVEVEVLWPFCGITGARHSIWRDMQPPCACIPQWSR